MYVMKKKIFKKLLIGLGIGKYVIENTGEVGYRSY